jgi:hypothetical protein
MSLPHGLCLHKEQSDLLWKTSFFSLFSAIYAFYRHYYDLMLVPGGVFLLSINYWRKPDYSWRRYADMIYVKMCLVYQLIRSYNAENGKGYYVITGIGCMFYLLGIYYFRRKEYWKSTYAHGMVHFCGNLGCFVLYGGYIVYYKDDPILQQCF